MSAINFVDMTPTPRTSILPAVPARRLLIAVFALLVLNGCSKEPQDEACSYVPTGRDYSGTAGTLIPMNTRNYWLYGDTVLDNPGRPDFLLTPKDVYEVEGHTSIAFNQFIPQLTIVGDSLHSTQWTPESRSCHTLRPYLFNVTDTTALDPMSRLYPDPRPCSTPAGVFSDNIVYQTGTGNAYRMTVHPGIGIIKVEMGNRTLSLRSYSVR